MVEIYVIPIPKEEKIPVSINKFFKSLYADSPEEYLFRLQDRQKLPSMLGYAALHHIMGQKTGTNRALRLDYTPQGKPFLPDFPNIHFNISHSGIYTCIGISTSDIGVDIERSRVCKLEIVKRFFHPQEAEDIAQLPEGDIRNNYFTSLWSLKESYVKQLGTGIANVLNNFAIRLQGDDIILLQGYKDNHPVFFKTYKNLNGYCLSVCSQESEFPESPTILLPEMIVS